MNGQMKPSPGRARQNRPAYPPHVVGMAASEMNDVFEGLDDAAWLAFVASLEQLMEVCPAVGPQAVAALSHLLNDASAERRSCMQIVRKYLLATAKSLVL